ncbi:GNAT family N-acetyltransferase [Enterococcus rivorum]|uniref:GNAT family N-acetyltransferase n=1 Tax=Enterococcus rivorum TaxID=762845 RepID=A0A1E5L1G6_9ENTE|nr:GNAT family N-acetyltransferase [Enterococcus rivorum]MBP2098756.1 ribosomal protein S18 acetylase RimI-like enzyme [Enterococcus rivorum]OEH83947.1 GNAT family N-acetyltransferase [Enterococcus rivorum]
MNIKKITTITAPHYELLLLADPAKKLVNDYVKRGIVFEIAQNHLLGIIVLLPTRPETLEIVNIAVHPAFQGEGIGQKLLAFALEYAKKENYQTIEIGTSSTGFPQLYLYQKMGFRMTSIDKDFFIRHYEEEIVENGLILKDMVRLSLDL